ncbi:hypothetical protein F5Y01DRAFT_55646 [Xylaria sp. FL0043]|nr:hypothetical protein F5Y01DRAFT_55646 [Xylaria sp. FL0043]
MNARSRVPCSVFHGHVLVRSFRFVAALWLADSSPTQPESSFLLCVYLHVSSRAGHCAIVAHAEHLQVSTQAGKHLRLGSSEG